MGKFIPFVFGAAAGAIGALLLAPQSGAETRNLVAEQAGGLGEKAQELGTQLTGKVQAGVKQAADKGEEIVNEATDAANNAADAAAEKNDELRAKIEAARERIAEQVKKNAAEAAKAADDAADKAADAAKDADAK